MPRTVEVARQRTSPGRFIFSLSLLVALCLCAAETARADQVELTSGSVGVNCNLGGQQGSVTLTGLNFTLQVGTNSDRSPQPCASPPVGLNVSTIGVPFNNNGTVTYQGVTTNIIGGSLLFDGATIRGRVVGLNFFNTSQALFTIDFTGIGVGTFSSSRATFNVVAAPEPSTMLLLGTGLAGAAALRRRRKG